MRAKQVVAEAGWEAEGRYEATAVEFERQRLDGRATGLVCDSNVRQPPLSTQIVVDIDYQWTKVSLLIIYIYIGCI